MDPSKAKEYEFLVIKHDPIYKELIQSIAMVKEFIISKKLIVYGGSAIDFALRLKGDFIYPDDAIALADLDFYSPNSVMDAYNMADILFDAGFTAARAIVGMHTDTMRVDFADNHFVADIHYIPKDIFDKIPTLVFDGMKIVHPHFQRIDMHSALSFPYDNPPLEVIFSRWDKDVKRFNKLNNSYPVIPGDTLAPKKITVKNFKRMIPTGFLAYSILYMEFVKIAQSKSLAIKGVTVAEFVATEYSYTFDGFDRAEGIHMDPEETARKLGATDIRLYESYAGILSRRVECKLENTLVDIYESHNRLISVNSLTVGVGEAAHAIRIINIQGLLRHFAAVAILNPNTKFANTCWDRYLSLLRMISIIGEYCVVGKSPFLLSIDTYGAKNINHATEKMLSFVYRELDGTPAEPAPKNYKPGNSRDKYEFDYDSSEVFSDRGREIKRGKA